MNIYIDQLSSINMLNSLNAPAYFLKINEDKSATMNFNHAKIPNIENEKDRSHEPSKKKRSSRNSFSKKEDELILRLVKIHGNKNWRFIAYHVSGRSPKQCRDRYTNYLAPGLFNGEWSKDEDELLIKLYNELGPKWSLIQKKFTRRSSASLKNRWHFFLSKQKLLVPQNTIFGPITEKRNDFTENNHKEDNEPNDNSSFIDDNDFFYENFRSFDDSW